MKKIDNLFWNEYLRLYDILNVVYPYQGLLKSVVSEMDLKSGKTVLDAGAGTGNLGVLISRMGARVVGLDSSEVGLKFFKDKLPSSEAILHDLKHRIPLPDNHFDYICCINTLFAVDSIHRDKICKEFYRLLKPRGKIVMTNLTVGYKPIRIYMSHAAEEIRRFGFFGAVLNLARLIKPTLKMFYYSKRLKREGGNRDDMQFFAPHEQESLLKNAGFIDVSGEKKLFARQAILSTGFKV